MKFKWFVFTVGLTTKDETVEMTVRNYIYFPYNSLNLSCLSQKF